MIYYSVDFIAEQCVCALYVVNTYLISIGINIKNVSSDNCESFMFRHDIALYAVYFPLCLMVYLDISLVQQAVS